MVKQLRPLAFLICVFSGISAHFLALQKNNGLIKMQTEKNDNFLEPPYCGVVKSSTSRVYGGTEVENYEFPWMVSLEVVCGGSLINSRWILTAAHCYTEEKGPYENAVVYLAAHKCTVNRDELGKQKNRTCDSSAKKATIKMVIRHEDFVLINKHPMYDVDNDIALLQLNEPVTFTDKIQPICLPWNNQAINIVGKEVITSGWGNTEHGNDDRNLLKVPVKITTAEDCKTYFADLINFDIKQFICAKGKGNADVGDSGGPLFIELPSLKDDENKSYYAIGITSFKRNDELGLYNTLVGYSNVSNYIPWIRKTILANE